MLSANLLGFGSPDDYEFGLFQVMECPKSPDVADAKSNLLGNVVKALNCQYYYALYAGKEESQ